MQVAPSEAIMIAAHAYDLRAAKTVWVLLLLMESFACAKSERNQGNEDDLCAATNRRPD